MIFLRLSLSSLLAATLLHALPAAAQRAPAPAAVTEVSLPLAPAPASRRRNPDMMIAGITLTSLGVATAVIAGTMIATVQPTRACANCGGGTEGQGIAGIIMLPFAGVETLVGIPLLIYGAQKVPAAPEQASLVPALVPASRGAALRWKF